MVDRRAQLLSATAHLEAPLGIVDDDALAANADDLVRRAGGVPIRVATIGGGETSAVVTGAAPTPVSTTTRTSSRDGTDSSRSASARAISPERALKTSGRLKVRRSTPSSSETSRPGTESGLRVMPRP